MAALLSLRDLYVEELRDLYNAESQLVKALPKMARGAQTTDLRKAFEEHLRQTKGHVDRLEQIFDALDKSPKGKRCVGMEGLIEEGGEIMDKEGEDTVIDAGLIVSAQKVEHYEMAGYGSVCAFAKLLGESEALNLLMQTLDEEKQADEKLSQIAESTVNVEAAEGDGTEVEDEEEGNGAEPRRQARGTSRGRK
jgi:ferritin-like metal-binding protein YciE